MTRAAQAKLLTLAMFGAGLISGALLMYFYEPDLEADAAIIVAPNAAAERQEFSSYLGLNEEQQLELERILERSRDRIRQLRAQTQPMYRSITDESRNEIRRMLNEQQLVEYEDWIQSQLQRRRERQAATNQ